ncbi:MAG: DUF4388 domain-containing protein [Proteobacteria bacterium]|nr:DUF4388 domain-containing protein [Pseudomonadota bacterium]
MPKLALRFISGKYKGGEYVLPTNKDIFIGRSSEIDLVLMEDMVSRKHARLWIQDKMIHIQDLGSTNGTFVNGEKISTTVINRGDRILIGTSIMKVVETDQQQVRETRTDNSPIMQEGSEVSRTTVHSSRSMVGTINEVPLPDLTQLFSTSKKTGTLVINRDDVIGKIHLSNGKLIYASISDSPNLSPLKAIYRILSWEDGTFELLGPESHDFDETIDMPTEHILMEGLRQLDEFRNMESKLPPMDNELVVIMPLLPRLADLSPEELDILQLVYNFGIVRKVLNEAAHTDANAASILANLISKNYIGKAEKSR